MICPREMYRKQERGGTGRGCEGESEDVPQTRGGEYKGSGMLRKLNRLLSLHECCHKFKTLI